MAGEPNQWIVRGGGNLHHFISKVKVADKGDSIVGSTVCSLNSDVVQVQIPADALAALLPPLSGPCAGADEVPLGVAENTILPFVANVAAIS